MVLQEQFSIGQSDYIVAVVSDDAERIRRWESQLVLNDDKYVINLERDVAILTPRRTGSCRRRAR